ncbi:hypothetical protein RND81_09G184800 [Saponaria officinalis]|uniref:Uncharacterized protein n=1 Tax=Saponaria officinalis TaxID=3572 RepID=A0AAW1IPI6_SAPOF
MAGNYTCRFRTSFPWVIVLGFFFAFAHFSEIGFLTIILTSSALILSPVIVVHRSKTPCAEERLAHSSEERLSSEQNYERNLSSSSDALSDSESHDQTTSSSDEFSENDSIFGENVPSNRESFSDGSISDEDSLIELALPTGHYLEPKRCSDYWSLESHFKQQNLGEMLSEMNEENLIEIDICMGSIKCSRFGIQA